MNDAIWVALIAGTVNLIGIAISRWHSSREHHQNAEEFRTLRILINGGKNGPTKITKEIE